MVNVDQGLCHSVATNPRHTSIKREQIAPSHEDSRGGSKGYEATNPSLVHQRMLMRGPPVSVMYGVLFSVHHL